MHWHIMYAHETHKQPDLIIQRDGKIYRATPSIIPHCIALEAPGLKPTREQIISFYNLLDDESVRVEFSCDARPIEEVFWAIRRLMTE